MLNGFFLVSFFVAGYNNFEVAEFLLEMGADVNAQDKGGLIPLHNASSYGHLDIAALLLKHNTIVNATDKWGFTPLHEGNCYMWKNLLFYSPSSQCRDTFLIN